MFSDTSEVFGHAIWGRPDPSEAGAILDLLAAVLERSEGRRAWLGDFREVEEVAPDAYVRAVDRWGVHQELFRERVARQAFLRAENVVGAVVAGWARLVGTPVPSAVFSDVDGALEALAVSAVAGRALLDDLASVHASASTDERVIRLLEGLFASEPTTDLAECARRLGVSRRALQRSLARAGTSFRAVGEAVQMNRAKVLLARGDSATSVALDVGYSSLQHFSTAFRRATGSTPSEWRDRASPRGRSTEASGRTPAPPSSGSLRR